MDLRAIFADELEKVGEVGLARRVRDGSDNSNGGEAALAAMRRVLAEATTPLGDDE